MPHPAPGFGGTAWAFAVAFIAEAAGIGLYAWSGETHQHGSAEGSPAAVDDDAIKQRRDMMGSFQRFFQRMLASSRPGDKKRSLGKEVIESDEGTALLGTKAADDPQLLLGSSDSSHGSALSVEPG